MSPPPRHLTRRPRFTRTKTGCLTCRTRRKKCDEAKPTCAGCMRNHLECRWPETKAPARAAVSAVSAAPESSNRADVQIQLPKNVGVGFGTLGIQTDRPCDLTPASSALLNHYLAETALTLASTKPGTNPFITMVVPLACLDDLLMHGILALSGMHLTSKEAANTAIQAATERHYGQLTRGLQAAMASLDISNVRQVVHLLLVLIMACHYEAISGETKGALFLLLRASRQLIVQLLSQPERVAQGATEGEREVLGLSLELYAYMVVVNAITPYGADARRTLPYDPFVLSLDASLGKYESFGTMFAGCHGLFELIPQANLLAAQRLAEQAAGHEVPSQDVQARQQLLMRLVDAWQMPMPGSGSGSGSVLGLADWDERTNAAEILRRGLSIYLLTALPGSAVPCAAARTAIQTHIDAMWVHYVALGPSVYQCPLLWACLVAGSCMTQPAQQDVLLGLLETSQYQMKHMHVMAHTLRSLWADGGLFGPYGLHLVMTQQNICLNVI